MALNNDIYYLTVSVANQFWHSFVGSSGSLFLRRRQPMYEPGMGQGKWFPSLILRMLVKLSPMQVTGQRALHLTTY